MESQSQVLFSPEPSAGCWLARSLICFLERERARCRPVPFCGPIGSQLAGLAVEAAEVAKESEIAQVPALIADSRHDGLDLSGEGATGPPPAARVVHGPLLERAPVPLRGALLAEAVPPL